MCLFKNLVVIFVSSNKRRKIVCNTCSSKDVALGTSLKKLKIEQPVIFEGLRMWQWNFVKYYIFIKLLKMGSINLAYVVLKLTKLWHIDFQESVVE